jgi:uncharacterized protein (TIGR03000 family)
MRRRRLVSVGTLGLLVLATSAGTAAAQFYDRSQNTAGRTVSVSTGPGYRSYVPSITHPAYRFYPGYYTGMPLASPFNTSVGNFATMPPDDTPIMMTSINYPGVYGRHVLGMMTFATNVTPAFAPKVYNPPTANPVGTPYYPLEVERAQPALLDVTLPADALLEIQNQRMLQTGALRQFQSPPLEPGQAYVYDLRASWLESGREVARTRRVEVRAGERVAVRFDRTTDEEGRSILRTPPQPVPSESPEMRRVPPPPTEPREMRRVPGLPR